MLMWSHCGERGMGTVRNPFLQAKHVGRAVGTSVFFRITSLGDRARAQFFKTSKNFEIGALLKTLQRYSCVTFMMKTEKGSIRR